MNKRKTLVTGLAAHIGITHIGTRVIPHLNILNLDNQPDLLIVSDGLDLNKTAELLMAAAQANKTIEFIKLEVLQPKYNPLEFERLSMQVPKHIIEIPNLSEYNKWEGDKPRMSRREQRNRSNKHKY